MKSQSLKTCRKLDLYERISKNLKKIGVRSQGQCPQLVDSTVLSRRLGKWKFRKSTNQIL